MARNEKELREAVNSLAAQAALAGLKINGKKSKLMRAGGGNQVRSFKSGRMDGV